MTGRGSISVSPKRRLAVMIGLQTSWFFLVMLLGWWWTQLVIRQATYIETLEKRVVEAHLETLETLGQAGGILNGVARAGRGALGRMLFWESSVFFLLLLGASTVLVWLYWREVLRSRSLQAFFASLTHELKTPLTSIRLQAESLQDDVGPGSSSAQALVGRLLEDTMRLESQVEKTLELARVEGGGAYPLRVVRLQPFLENLLQPWRETHQGRMDIERVNIDNIAGDIMADHGGLTVVLRNILENSLRHSGKDVVRVRITGSAFHEKNQSGKFKLVVEDDGCGPDPRYLKGMGELYAKGEASSGAGVGLYLVKTLMARMDGEAHFERGTTGFRTTLSFTMPPREESVS